MNTLIDAENNLELQNDNRSWRYQTVYTKVNEELLDFSICKVYLDKDSKLEMWAEQSAVSPSGDTLEELFGDLQFMLDDAHK